MKIYEANKGLGFRLSSAGMRGSETSEEVRRVRTIFSLKMNVNGQRNGLRSAPGAPENART